MPAEDSIKLGLLATCTISVPLCGQHVAACCLKGTVMSRHAKLVGTASLCNCLPAMTLQSTLVRASRHCTSYWPRRCLIVIHRCSAVHTGHGEGGRTAITPPGRRCLLLPACLARAAETSRGRQNAQPVLRQWTGRAAHSRGGVLDHGASCLLSTSLHALGPFCLGCRRRSMSKQRCLCRHRRTIRPQTCRRSAAFSMRLPTS